MPHVKTWDDFARHAEMLYLNDPNKVFVERVIIRPNIWIVVLGL